MATIQADNRTKADSPTSDNVLSPGTLGGRVRVLTDQVTLAAEGNPATIEVGRKLQAGAIILGVELYNAALGAATTLDVGDSDDPNRYLTIADANTAGWTKDLNLAGVQYKVGTNDGDDEITITLGGGAGTGLVAVNVYYTED